MAFAPQQNWQLYESLTGKRDAEKFAAMDPQQKFDRYVNLFDLLHAARLKRNFDRVAESDRWEEKKSLRLRMVGLFLKMDEGKRGSINTPDRPQNR